MTRLDPGNARVPSVRLANTPVQQIINGEVTCLLLHHGTISWHDKLAPGFDFFAWTTRRNKRGVERAAARVRTVRACVHSDVYSIRDCPAAHRPEAARPGKAGWRRIWDAAVLTGEPGPLERSRWREKFAEPWTVVDVECIDTDRLVVPRQRHYRNQTEAALAEQSRQLEVARLAAASQGLAAELSDDERRFRAMSAVYNRKLSKALDAGADTSALTVTDAEITAELSRLQP